jgi:hypothetical protein
VPGGLTRIEPEPRLDLVPHRSPLPRGGLGCEAGRT